jgi:phosphoglycerol transferase
MAYFKAYWISNGLLLRFTGCLLIAFGISRLIGKYLDTANSTANLIFGLLLVILLGLFARHRGPTRPSWLIWSFFPLILIGFWYYFVVEFGNFSWSSIIFHLSGGLDQSDAVEEYLKKARSTANAVVAVGFGVLALKNGSAAFQRFEKLLAGGLLVVNPAVISGFLGLVALGSEDTGFIETYKTPVESLAQGQKPRNFIHVFLESTERTLYDEAVFGNAMKPLERFEQAGFSATNMMQVEHTSWSVAGMTAAYCGVPLSPVGMVQKNNFSKIANFLPNAVCLGDVLSKYAYELTYVVGSDPEFGGIMNLYKDHGFAHVIGYDDLVIGYPEIAETRYSHGKKKWGAHDDIIFKEGLRLVRNKVNSGKPFGLVLETIGGHSPVGNFSPACRDRADINRDDVDILQSIRCTNLLFGEFMSQLEKEGLLENTIVVVQSDHLGMQSKILSKLEQMERRNLFFVFGDGVSNAVADRAATMMDIYPTLTELLGFELESHQAGVGISLLSDKITLAGQYDHHDLEKLIQGDKKLSQTLWRSSGN